MKLIALIALAATCLAAPAQTQTSPTKINPNQINFGPSTYITGSGDLGVLISNADTATLGSPARIVVEVAGTISTAFTLSANHSLEFDQPVTFANYITPTTNNLVECAGPQATITNGMSSSSVNADGVNAFFYAPSSAAEVEHFTVKGCTFNGYGAHSGYIFASHGPTQDVSILNNDAITAALYFQTVVPVTNPTLRLKVIGNTCDWTASVQNSTAVCVSTTGAIQHSIIADNHFFDPYYAVELFGATSGGLEAANIPTQAQIETSAVSDNLFANNELYNVYAGIWVSTAYHNTWVGNHATTCSDYCYGVEAGSHNSFQGNTAINGSFGQEYEGFGNAFTGNSIVGPNIGFFNTAATDASVYNANKYSTGNGAVGVFLYEEATDTHVKITNNDVVDGLIAYGSTYISSQLIQNNTFFFDAAIPSSGIGTTTGAGCGLSVGNFQDNTYSITSGNTVITTVSQTQPALCIGLSQPNIAETALFLNDTLIGPWSTDVALVNSSNNSATAKFFELRGIEFASGVVTATASSSAPVSVVCKAGGKGGSSSVSISYSYNGGTASSVACN